MTSALGYVVGDLHWPERYGRGSWADLPEVHGDVEHALRQCVAMCVADSADLYMVGDNIDGPDPDPESLKALYEILRPITDAKRDIYYILGNHERGRDWLSPLGPRAIRIEDGKPLFTRTGKTICGLSYLDPNVFEEAVRKVPATAIGLYHQAFREWTGGGRGFSLACLPNHLLTIVGDTHVSDAITDLSGVRLSPGPLAPQTTTEFSETVNVWRIEQDLQVTPVPIRGRTRVRYEVDTLEAADKVLERIARLDTKRVDVPARLARPLVAVRLRTPIDGFLDVLRKLANDRGISLRVSDDSGRRSPRTPVTASGASTLADAVAGWPAPLDVRELALRAIAPGADVKAVLQEDLCAEIANTRPA